MSKLLLILSLAVSTCCFSSCSDSNSSYSISDKSSINSSFAVYDNLPPIYEKIYKEYSNKIHTNCYWEMLNYAMSVQDEYCLDIKNSNPTSDSAGSLEITDGTGLCVFADFAFNSASGTYPSLYEITIDNEKVPNSNTYFELSYVEKYFNDVVEYLPVGQIFERVDGIGSKNPASESDQDKYISEYIERSEDAT
jgi:hypothetical protein